MRIFFVAPYAPTRIRVRAHQFIRSLHRLGHSVTVATLIESDDEAAGLRELKDEGIHVVAQPLGLALKAANVLRALPTREPLQARFSWQPKLGAQLVTLAREADVVHVEHLRGARYALALQSHAKTPVVWDSVDCITSLFEQAAPYRRGLVARALSRVELPRTRRLEAMLARQFAAVVVTAPSEARALRGLAPSSDDVRVSVVANGVDLDYFSPRSSEPTSPIAVVFTGKLSYHANTIAALHLAHDIMPRVWASCPDARLVVAGARPTRAVRDLARRDARIEVVSPVPHMNALLRSAAVATAPMIYGAGIQNKVLEAMACGVPVVAARSAMAALEHAREGETILARDAADAFADAIIALLRDSALRARLGNAGRAYVEAHHRWDTLAEKLVAVYERAREGNGA